MEMVENIDVNKLLKDAANLTNWLAETCSSYWEMILVMEITKQGLQKAQFDLMDKLGQDFYKVIDDILNNYKKDDADG